MLILYVVVRHASTALGLTSLSGLAQMVQPRTSPSLSVWVIPMAVMTAAIGLPLAVHKFSGNPATVAAIGMLSGFWSGWLTLGVSHDGESRTGL